MSQAVAGHAYEVKADHRDRTAIKSQWTIPVSGEHAVLEGTVANSWTQDSQGWGLHLENGVVSKLGESAKAHGKVYDLYVAFFVFAPVCHGYPSDPVRSTRELPPASVLKDWQDQELLRPQALRKMGRGLRCKP